MSLDKFVTKMTNLKRQQPLKGTFKAIFRFSEARLYSSMMIAANVPGNGAAKETV